MIEEINEETLHICVGRVRETPPLYVAHCYELDLIGESSNKDEAISRLKKIIKIQYRIYEDNDTEFFAQDVDSQWIKYHKGVPLGSPEESELVIEKRRKCSNGEFITVHLKIDKSPRITVNKDARCEEFPLLELISILRNKGISWRISEELDYGYFIGPWPPNSDGPLQSYPFYAPADMTVHWYHLRSIALRFGLDDFRTSLF